MNISKGLSQQLANAFTLVPFIFNFFFFKIYLFIICKCSCLQTLQKMESDLITDGCEPPCGCWDLNSRPSESHHQKSSRVLLPTEPSHQPPYLTSNFSFKSLNPKHMKSFESHSIGLAFICAIVAFILNNTTITLHERNKTSFAFYCSALCTQTWPGPKTPD